MIACSFTGWGGGAETLVKSDTQTSQLLIIKNKNSTIENIVSSQIIVLIRIREKLSVDPVPPATTR